MKNAKNRSFAGVKPNQIVQVEDNRVARYELAGFVVVTGKVKEKVDVEEKAKEAMPEDFTEDQILNMRKFLVGKTDVKDIRGDKRVVKTAIQLGWTPDSETAEENAGDELAETLDELNDL